MNAFSAKPFENILIDEEERLDRSYMAVVVNNRKISVLEVTPESIVQDFVVPIIFSLVGESGCPRRASRQFGTRHNGNRERFMARAGNAQNNSAHLFTPQGPVEFVTPRGANYFPLLQFRRRRVRECFCLGI